MDKDRIYKTQYEFMDTDQQLKQYVKDLLERGFPRTGNVWVRILEINTGFVGMVDYDDVTNDREISWYPSDSISRRIPI